MTFSRPISLVDTVPPIEMFSAAIVGNGIADDSVAFKAAVDAAVASGLREVHCGKQYNVPTLTDAGNLILLGPGKLIGNYRKKVIPYSSQSLSIPGGVNPAKHLTALAATSTPVVVHVGDSLITWPGADPNIQSYMDQLEWLLRAKFIRDNPTKTFTFYNRGIPGCNWTDLNSNPFSNHTVNFTPAWYTNTANAWLTYVESLAPDGVVINLGTNDRAGLNSAHVKSVIDKLKLFAKIPDIIVTTPQQWSSSYVPQKATQNGADMAAGLIRTFARTYTNIGLIDFHRQSVLSVDGYDIENTASEDIILGTAPLDVTFPYTLSEEVQDFDITMRLDNTGGALFSGSDQVQIGLGGLAATRFYLIDNAGNLAMRIAGGYSGANPFSQVNGIATTPTGQFTWRVAKKGCLLYSDINGGTPVVKPIYVFGGQLAPTIAKMNGAAGAAFRINRLSYGRHRLYMPTLTDKELYGNTAGTDTFGGNGINHPTSISSAMIMQQVLERTNLAA